MIKVYEDCRQTHFVKSRQIIGLSMEGEAEPRVRVDLRDGSAIIINPSVRPNAISLARLRWPDGRNWASDDTPLGGER